MASATSPDAFQLVGHTVRQRGRAYEDPDHALKFADDQLHMDPRNRKLCVQRIQCLAKLGHCDEVRAAHAADADTLATGNAELTHRLAKAYAVCGWRAEALASVKRAVELGISPAVMRAEDEFAALVKDPAFPN